MIHIRTSFSEFVARYGGNLDELNLVRQKVENGAILSGGAIRRVIMNEKPSDYDFFFYSKPHMENWISTLSPDFHKTKETKHHHEFVGKIEGIEKPVKIQAIHFKYYDTPEEIIDSFDFTICMFAINGDELIITPEALYDLGRKRLAINKLTYPVSTMRRLLKYKDQGFTAYNGCLTNLLEHTILLSTTDPKFHDSLETTYVD